MQPERIFGTDGIRGRAGEGWLSTARVSSLGAALARTVLGGRGRVLLGHDGRRSGPELQDALTHGLAAGGARATTTGLITTPGLAWLARSGDWALGAMISASHNPAHDNGIKLFNQQGEKLDDAQERELERALAAEVAQRPEGHTSGPGPDEDEALERAYIEHLVSGSAGAAGGPRLDGRRIVLDCANGGGSRVGPRVLAALGADAVCLATSPDGDNINDGCGSTHMEALQAEVPRRGAELGIALDGDGDRCLLVDENGTIVHGDGILTLLSRHAAESWSDRRIVATVMSNKGLARALRDVGVVIETVDVGDRYVVERLRQEGLPLGGEQSGHIVFRDNHFIGDGIYTALRVLAVLAGTGKPLSELAGAFREFPQVLINVPVATKPPFETLPAVTAAVGEVEGQLGEDGRVLLRYSGTEPLARVMVEGPNEALIRGQAESIAALVARELAAEAR